MRNKIIAGVLTVCIAVGSLFTLTACDQQTAIYYDAGKYAVIAWLAIDNPSDEVKMLVADSANYIIEHANEYEPGQFFADMFYDKLCELIDEKTELEENVKTYVKAGTLIVLKGLDMLLADNEKIASKTDEAVKVAKAFSEGAMSMLVYKSKSPVLAIAREKRAQLGLK